MIARIKMSLQTSFDLMSDIKVSPTIQQINYRNPFQSQSVGKRKPSMYQSRQETQTDLYKQNKSLKTVPY